MTAMIAGVEWLVGDDSPLSIVANTLAVGTFALGVLGIRFANRTRQELREIRRRLPTGDAFADREALQNIQLLRRVHEGDDTRWHIAWSRLRSENPADCKQGQATITSQHLLNVLETKPSRIDQSKTAIVVGSVAYADHGGGVYSSVTVPTVHHINGDQYWRQVWLALRRGVGRILAEVG
jgi:hypothetical protein